MNDVLSSPVSALRGVGPQRARLLAGLGIETLGDLLRFFPRRYEDRRCVTKISKLATGKPAVIFAVVDGSERKRLAKKGFELVTVDFSDETGTLTASWFNRKGLEYILKEGVAAALYGVPSVYRNTLTLSNPEFEVVKNESEAARFTGIIPIYPSTAGLPERWFRHLLEDALKEYIQFVDEILPEDIIEKRKLFPVERALTGMHRPVSEEEWRESRRRLVYEEFLLLQAGMALRRESLKKNPPAAKITSTGKIYKAFRESLPFALTKAQDEALDEIFSDTVKEFPMSRLLQGDVGSGKTLVAVGFAAAAVDAGAQAVVMAPTEVLADQLYSQMQKWLAPKGVSCLLLKGGQSASVRKKALASIKDGSAQIIAGTQALIEDGVDFKNLGAVVIDEQHRFGVMQRAALAKRRPAPHLLMMSATPIPRTLALCLFGDLDISTLREKPQGRRKTETRLIDVKKMGTLLQFIASEIRAGGRVYWVCPRVGDDGVPDIASVEKRYAFISKHIGALGAGFIHGRMESAEKEKILNAFRSGEIKILVGTTVVEVGVDVPEASIIVVESPERFGLSQLHQLRGRVGRGGRRGVCVLLASSLDGDVPERLGVMLRTDDGFEIAEADLAFRGAGELSGSSQHGITEFKIADLSKDLRLLLEAKEDAAEWVARDPELKKSPLFMNELKNKLGEALGIG